jgi:hypothetical protein
MKELYYLDTFLTKHVQSKYYSYNKQMLHDTCIQVGIDFTNTLIELDIMHTSINLRWLSSDIQFMRIFKTGELRGFEYVL